MAAAMRHLPVACTSAIAGHLGARHGHQAIRARRRWVGRLHANIERFSGVADPAERERRILAYTRRFGRIYAEFTVLQRIVREDRLEVVGSEHLRNLSRPVIAVSGHMANWELVGHVASLVEGDACAIYAPPDNPIRHRLAVQARLGWGKRFDLVPSSDPSAMRRIAGAIARGRNLLMYVDEERDGYVWAPSLGRQLPYAGNRWLTARLAVRHGVDIVPVHVEAAGDARYRLIIEPKLVPGDGDDLTRARALADQLDQHLDRWVRAQPEHWYWLPMLDLDKPLPGRS
jgi:lauroyl/myristoyl acyltransferase